MTKGDIIKISGGKIQEIAKSDYVVYADTIQSNAGKSVIEHSNDGIIFGEPEKPPVKEAKDFDIKIELLKKENTLLPLGIPDYKGKLENKFLRFKITISGKGVNQWQLDIKKDDKIIYTGYSASGELKTVEIKGESKNKSEGGSKSDIVQKNERFWPAGEYDIVWDGFDKQGIYNSKLLTDKGSFIATIKGQAEFRFKEARTAPFHFKYDKVNWVDLVIDRTNKRMDVTLRVDLRDGGAKGIELVKMGGVTDPNKVKYAWEDIPASEIAGKKREPVKSRIRDFEQLKKLTLFGLKEYWSRNKANRNNPDIGKNVMIDNEPYDVFVNPVISETNTLNQVDLIFNTNGDWYRSGNPGVMAKLSYNVGYIKYSNGWGYQEVADEDVEFAFTAAHEIGHPILLAYRGYGYSWQHKGSSYLFPQDAKPTSDKSLIKRAWNDGTHVDQYPGIAGEYYPEEGEIDLMKYYSQKIDAKTGDRIPVISKFGRSIAASEDVIGLLWLTKLEISEK